MTSPPSFVSIVEMSKTTRCLQSYIFNTDSRSDEINDDHDNSDDSNFDDDVN